MGYEEIIKEWVAKSYNIDIDRIERVEFYNEAWVGCETCGDYGVDIEIHIFLTDSGVAFREYTGDFGSLIREVVEFTNAVS